MVVFGVWTEKRTLLDEFFQATDSRLKVNNFIKNPFKGFVDKIEREDGVLNIISMTPIYPNPFLIGLCWSVGQAYIFGFNAWLILPLCLMIAGIFWTDYFLFFMLRIAIRKIGYKDRLTYVDASKVVEEIYNVSN